MRTYLPMHKRKARPGREGAALVVALSLLVVFTLFGTAFVKYMSLELSRATLDLRETRARILAEAGIRVAAAELQRALEAGDISTAEKRVKLNLPTYEMMNQGGGVRSIGERGVSTATAEYAITDENAKLNLNHAPVSVIKEVLGVDSYVIRPITQSLPAENPSGRWLTHLDELRTRDLVDKEGFDALPLERVTVSTVLDHENPAPHININTAPQKMVDAVKNAPAMAHALTTVSRCFRITCVGVYKREGWPPSSAQAEAVLLFDDNGEYRILEWRTEGVEMPEEDTDAADAEDAGAQIE